MIEKKERLEFDSEVDISTIDSSAEYTSLDENINIESTNEIIFSDLGDNSFSHNELQNDLNDIIPEDIDTTLFSEIDSISNNINDFQGNTDIIPEDVDIPNNIELGQITKNELKDNFDLNDVMNQDLNNNMSQDIVADNIPEDIDTTLFSEIDSISNNINDFQDNTDIIPEDVDIPNNSELGQITQNELKDNFDLNNVINQDLNNNMSQDFVVDNIPEDTEANENSLQQKTKDFDPIDYINQSDLSNHEKIEEFKNLKIQLLNLEGSNIEDLTRFPEEQEANKVLKIKDSDLLEIGNNNIEKILDAKEDDYKDKGLTEDEIINRIELDRIEEQKSFLKDAFPENDLSINVFDHFNTQENNFKVDKPFESESKENLDIELLLERIDESDISSSDQKEILEQMKNELLQYDSIQSEINNSDVVGEFNLDTKDIKNWLSDINPNFDCFDISSPYSNNCGSCAFAVSQRLDGDTDITATAENIGTVLEMNELTGMEQVQMSPEKIKEYLLELGPGSHAIIGIDRADGPGHWFNALCLDNNTVVAIDGQTSEIHGWPPDYGDVTNWDISIRRNNVWTKNY